MLNRCKLKCFKNEISTGKIYNINFILTQNDH